MKYLIIIIAFFSTSFTLAQGDSKPPAFLDPKIDSIAFINCNQETLDSIISYVRKNPKFVVENLSSCKAKVLFTIEKNFSINIKVDEVQIMTVFKDKKSRKYSESIKKYYEDQVIQITLNLFGLFIPQRVNGEYYPSKFYINIDFLKGDRTSLSDTIKSRIFDSNDLSNTSISMNHRLKEKGIELLKKKKPLLAHIYLRMAYYISKDVDAVVLLGNLWDVMGETETACLYWNQAIKLGNMQAKDLIKKCDK